MKILVSGYLIRKPVAGLAWHYGQYLVGLRRLGHDVLYIEDSEELAGDLDAKLAYAQAVFRYLGLSDKWMLFDFQTNEWKGPAAGSAKQALADADAIISVSGPVVISDWLQNVPVRIFVDTDPVFTQAKTINYPGWSARCASYNFLASFAENLNRPDCGVPRDGFKWHVTRQPIVLDLWETQQTPRPVFTTIMSWKSYAPVRADGTRFGVKAQTFGAVKSLPGKTSTKMEIALDADSDVQADLSAHGWGIVPAEKISATADDYKAYIQSSAGEFTVAKEAYVQSRCGWFSERSACYLASGRPVITQDTGFSTWLESDRGVLSFRSGEDALAAIDSVIGAYDLHANAARELANYFDSAFVLQKLLDDAQAEPCGEPAEGSPAALSWNTYHSIVGQIACTVGEDESLVLIDDCEFGLVHNLGQRRVYPFLEKNGQYWGKPRDSLQAIMELRRLIEAGVSHLIILKDSRWWIGCYPEFWQFVTNNGSVELATEELTILGLKQKKRNGTQRVSIHVP